MYFTKEKIANFEEGAKKEWLLTNGIGSFAAGSLNGSNTRRYHGLLVAASSPPVDRHVVVSNVHESFEINGKKYSLATFECAGGYKEDGFDYLTGFQNNFLPTWHYKINDILLTKQIWMVYGKNTTVITYRIKNGEKKSLFSVLPLINYRDYHGERLDFSPFRIIENKGNVEIRFDEFLDETLKIVPEKGIKYNKINNMFFNMYYQKEADRGLNSVENHFMPGSFEIELKPFEEKRINIVFTTENNAKINLEEEYLDALSRNAQLIEKAGFNDSFKNALVKACDDFIVYRKSTNGKTIIAGYPWFTDWGRDTLIALTGLTITTKRFDDAKSILKTFMKYIKDGLLPNVFPDFAENPGYNTVDAPMCFFVAVYNYINATNDTEFLEEVYEKLIEIYNRYSISKEELGDREIIYKDVDELIYSGSEKTQLTWMDAKVGDYVVTPRFGKAVEINALWYNANMIMADLSKRLKKKDIYSKTAKLIKENFIKTFWYDEKGYLYDVVNENGNDTSIRPNQIFALSLNFPVLEGGKAESVFNVVADELYTNVGLRTLSPKDERYRSIYSGDIWARDTAYHQGIVWTWPLGGFITASKKLNLDKGKYSTENIINNLKYTLEEETIGQINEIFDAESPYTPRGCFAQAWSVAEILRAISE